jgi:hypothetical protein
MKYKIEKVENKKFSLTEISSENLIGVFDTWEQARNMSKHLLKGYGFNGWTPSFFLENLFVINKSTPQHVAKQKSQVA